MKIELVSEYKKHGCNYTGNLALVDYQKELENDPRHGQWNSGIDYKYSKQAMDMMKEVYPNCTVLLSIPDVLVRIDWSKS